MKNIITIKKDSIMESCLYYAKKNYTPSRSDKARKCQKEKIMHNAMMLRFKGTELEKYMPLAVKELKHCYHVKVRLWLIYPNKKTI